MKIESQAFASIAKMRTTFFLLFLLLGSTVYGQKPISLGGTIAPSWVPIFKGIEMSRGDLRNDRDLQKCVAVRIDLRSPGLHFFATPSNGPSPKETFPSRVGNFLIKHKLQLVVNTSFFDPCCSDLPKEGKDLAGLAVAQGQLVSPWSDTHPVGIAVAQKGNQPYVIKSAPKTVQSLQFAIAGNTLLTEGQVTRKPNDKKEPRTAVGFSKDGRYLIFIVIDGRSRFHSLGANLYHTGLWLIRFGAWEGCNLDGGGSSSMAIDDGRGGYRLLNHPSSGRERYVGNILGVYATPLGAIRAKEVKEKKTGKK